MIGLYLFILYEGYFWLLIRMVFDSDWFKMKTSDWIIDDSESVERKQNNNEQQIMTHVNDSYNSLFGLQETDWFAHANYQNV